MISRWENHSRTLGKDEGTSSLDAFKSHHRSNSTSKFSLIYNIQCIIMYLRQEIH